MDFTQLLKARPLVAAHLKKDFGSFCRAAWPHLHPGSKLSWTPAHDLICEYLMLVWEKRLTRLIINCPPRFAKSSIVTILFPVWVWLQAPTTDFLACSYEIDLATNHNLDRRSLMTSKWFRDLFGDSFQVAAERAQAGEFSNDHGGTMMAASVNSRAQGRGGHYVLLDDPLSADQCYSESTRNETNLWLTNQLPQRLNDPATSAIILVMQRLHQNDPTGFLLAQEENEWKLLKLPLIAEEDEIWTFPISGRVWKRKKGECLDPKRWSPKVVKERQRDRLTFAGQFQQSPMDAAGNLIRTNDIMFYGGKDPQTGALDGPLPERFDRTIISVDCSFKTTLGSDFVALAVIGVVGARRYLIYVVNARLDLTGTLNEIRNAHIAFAPIGATVVEAAANGHAVIAALKDQIPGLIAVDPQGSKMSRLVAASPEFAARNWYIERHGPWTNKVVEQLTMFPNARNDDLVDAISQASIWLQANSYELGLIDYLKNLVTGKRQMPASVAEYAQVAVAAKPQARAEGNKGQPPKAGPCPACQSTATIRAATAGTCHCNQCGTDFDMTSKIMASPRKAGPCCDNFLPQRIPAGIRCGSCGAQTVKAVAVSSYNRKNYRDDSFSRMFGRFG